MTETTVRTSDRPSAALDGRGRLAWAVTRSLDPMNTILVVMVTVGAVRDGWDGAAWGLVGALCAGVVPQLGIAMAVRKGSVGDRYVHDRARRMTVLPLIMVSVAVGVVLLRFGHAPGDLTAMIIAQFATLIPVTAITAKWKISLHTGALGGAVAMLTIALGPWLLAGYILVAVVAWSRVVLKDHTTAQVIAGAVAGTLVAGAVFWAVR